MQRPLAQSGEEQLDTGLTRFGGSERTGNDVLCRKNLETAWLKVDDDPNPTWTPTTSPKSSNDLGVLGHYYGWFEVPGHALDLRPETSTPNPKP